MPYVKCGRCGLKTFSAAYWSNIDYCAGCGAEFPVVRRKVVSIARYRSPLTPPTSSQPDRGDPRLPDADDQR